jgi:hypothetical protein
MSDKLTAIQVTCAAWLNAQEFYSHASEPVETRKPILVITEDVASIQQAIDEALSLLGLAVTLVTPVGDAYEGEAAPPMVKPLLMARVDENVTINRGGGTGQPVLKVCADVACRLHQNPALVSAAGDQVWLNFQGIQITPNAADGIASYAVVFQVSEPIALEAQSR